MAEYIIYQIIDGVPTWWLCNPSIYWESDKSKAYKLNQAELVEVVQRLTTMQRISAGSMVFAVECVQTGKGA